MKAHSTIITITKIVSEPLKIVNKTYHLIEYEKLKKDSIQILIVKETIKQIVKNNEVGHNILRSTLNKWLLSLNNVFITNRNHINGNFDSGILPKMNIVQSINTKGLLYWKNNNRFYLRLNI